MVILTKKASITEFQKHIKRGQKAPVQKLKKLESENWNLTPTYSMATESVLNLSLIYCGLKN